MRKTWFGMALVLMASMMVLGAPTAAADHCPDGRFHVPIIGNCVSRPVDPAEMMVRLDADRLWVLLRFGDL